MTEYSADPCHPQRPDEVKGISWHGRFEFIGIVKVEIWIFQNSPFLERLPDFVHLALITEEIRYSRFREVGNKILKFTHYGKTFLSSFNIMIISIYSITRTFLLLLWTPALSTPISGLSCAARQATLSLLLLSWNEASSFKPARIPSTNYFVSPNYTHTQIYFTHKCPNTQHYQTPI